MRIEFNQQELRPLVEIVVGEVLERTQSDQAGLDGRLSFTEAEAAALLGIPSHTLRDLRLAGYVTASKLGRRVVYSREELLRLLEQKRMG
jgi:hypothetical protein